MRTVLLDGRSLTAEAVHAVAERRVAVQCAPDAIERVRLARRTVEGIIERDETVYGINTGFGALVNTRIDSSDLCLLYTSPSPRDRTRSRMPSSA